MNGSHAHKATFWYLLGVRFKLSDDHPRYFYMGSPGRAILRRVTWQTRLVKRALSFLRFTNKTSLKHVEEKISYPELYKMIKLYLAAPLDTIL